MAEKTGSKGGLLVGKSHKEGGIDIIVPEGKIEAEGDEIILTKGVYQSKEKVGDIVTPDMTKREAASALNESEGGIKIAEKGAKVDGKEKSRTLDYAIGRLLAVSGSDTRKIRSIVGKEILYKSENGKLWLWNLEKLRSMSIDEIDAMSNKFENTAAEGTKIGNMERGKNILYSQKESFYWGDLVLLKSGNMWKAVLHPENIEAIKNLPVEESYHFDDEQRKTWIVQNLGGGEYFIRNIRNQSQNGYFTEDAVTFNTASHGAVISVGDRVGNTVQGFDFEVLKINNDKMTVRNVITKDEFETFIDNMYKPKNYKASQGAVIGGTVRIHESMPYMTSLSDVTGKDLKVLDIKQVHFGSGTQNYLIVKTSDGKIHEIPERFINPQASQGAKISNMKPIYYLKEGHILKEPNLGKIFKIKSISGTGLILEEPTIFKEEAHSEHFSFEEFIALIEEYGLKFRTAVLGSDLPYENERDRALLLTEIDSIKSSHQIAEYGKKIEGLKKSHDDTMAGVEALANKGKMVEDIATHICIKQHEYVDSYSPRHKSVDIFCWVGDTVKWDKDKKVYEVIKGGNPGMEVNMRSQEEFDEYFKPINKASKGAKIENGYKDSYGNKYSPEQIWDMWTPKQRKHFLTDQDAHKIADMNGVLSKEFLDLDSKLQSLISEHVNEGQYSGGGKTGGSMANGGGIGKGFKINRSEIDGYIVGDVLELIYQGDLIHRFNVVGIEMNLPLNDWAARIRHREQYALPLIRHLEREYGIISQVDDNPGIYKAILVDKNQFIKPASDSMANGGKIEDKIRIRYLGLAHTYGKKKAIKTTAKELKISESQVVKTLRDLYLLETGDLEHEKYIVMYANETKSKGFKAKLKAKSFLKEVVSEWKKEGGDKKSKPFMVENKIKK